ncbi:MAG: HAD family hydrolase [Thermoleophilia bacterium]
MLRAVTFDYWNTLFVDVRGRERERRRAEMLRAELARLGLDPPARALAEALQAGFDFFDRVWLRERRTPLCAETVDATLAALHARLPDEARARLVHAFERVLLDLPPEPMPGALYTLPLLAERYRLAVICDTGYSPGSVLRELMERCGMLAYFEYLYFSDEHGMCKPDVRVFQHTLAELGVRAGEAAHVGDLQRTDIAGAQAAGMAAVHFIAANNSDAARSTGDLLVRHFDELPVALGGLTCAGC